MISAGAAASSKVHPPPYPAFFSLRRAPPHAPWSKQRVPTDGGDSTNKQGEGGPLAGGALSFGKWWLSGRVLRYVAA